MKWNELSKEQKQYIFLGGIVAVALIYVLFTVLTGLSDDEGEEGDGAAAEVNLEDLEDQVDKAEVTVRKERMIVENYQKTLVALEDMKDKYFPNEDNRYSWVTELIYTESRKSGIEVEQISELGQREPEGQQLFQRYAVQVNLSCSYDKLIDLIRFLEKSNPLMKIFEVSVSSNKEDPLNHHARLVMVWPTSMDIQKIKEN